MAIGQTSYPGALDDATSLLRTRATRTTFLRFPVSATETTIPVLSTTGATSDGAILIDDEVVIYTGLTDTSFTGCTRGALQQDGYGAAAAHAIGATVTQGPLPTHTRVLADAVQALEARVESTALGTAVNAQTGTSYTLAATDLGKLVLCTNASAIAVTVPAGLGEAFRCRIGQGGAGRVTVSGASGVTVSNRQSYTKTAAQYAVVELVAAAANAYWLLGDTGA